MEWKTCDICHKKVKPSELIPAAWVRPQVAALIQSANPQWNENSSICLEDLAGYRTQYIQQILKAEKGELTELEAEVLESLHRQEILSADVEADFEENLGLGERMADGVAKFGGSWKFIISFGFFLVLWIAFNSVALWMHPLDPFPYIFLNLILSCLAAIQAPVIMMSQNRQEAKDRLRSKHDYQVNLKAELEIRHLHEKVDHLLSRQWERLMEVQQVQIELLNQMIGMKSPPVRK